MDTPSENDALIAAGLKPDPSQSTDWVSPGRAPCVIRVTIAIHVLIVAHFLACTRADYGLLISPEVSDWYWTMLGWSVAPLFWVSPVCAAIVIDLHRRKLVKSASGWPAIIAEVLLTVTGFFSLLPLVQ